VAEQASDLSTYATLATELGGGVTSVDPRLPRLLSAASDAIRKHLNRPLMHYSSAHTELVAGYGTNRLVLSRAPVLSITSVTLSDGSEVDADEYSVEDSETGLVYRDTGWPFTGLTRSLLPPQADLLPGSEKRSITVIYAGGWVTPAQAGSSGWSGPARSLPYDLEQAAIDVVRAMYRGAPALGIASESVGSASVSYFAEGAGGSEGYLPGSVVSMLSRYRVPAVG